MSSSPDETAGSRAFRVMTFNTANDFIAPADLVDMLRESNAAIAGLQELGERNAAALDMSLRDVFPHRWLYGEHIRGKAFLSRFPIVDLEHFDLPSGRLYIHATIDMNGLGVQVFVAHLPPGDYRKLQAIDPVALVDLELLLGRVDAGQPTLLLGDFNVVTRSRIYRRIRRAGFVDTFRVAGRGPGFTYPTRHAHRPIPLPRLMRIDYIWATQHFRPVRSWVARGMGSDHQAVVAELELTGG
jgi:vancomycin resistance protein VanJ